MIDYSEDKYRRDGIDLESSAPVVMADGQIWYLPKPWTVIRPIFRDGKAIDSWAWFTYGPELDGMVKVVRAAQSAIDTVIAIGSLAAFLLQRNYELTDVELEELIQYRIGDPASDDMVKAVMDIATGTSGPKVSSGGGVSPS